MRFTRDRRGYEHTCIMHAGRRHGKKEGRLLYWFRTPPNVKVGRAPIDEEAIRAIEQQHPDLEFDWARMSQVRPAGPVEPAAGRGGRRGRDTRAAEPAARGAASRAGRSGRSAGRRESAPPAGPPEEPVPAPETAAAGLTPNVELPDLPDLPERASDESFAAPPLPESARPVPAEELVGAEGLARLRTRYAEVQARISERGGDPARIEQLRKEADALNPDAWVTLDEARQALEQTEAVFDGLRRALGRRRRSRRGGARRSRRRRAATAEGQPGETTPASEGQTAAPPESGRMAEAPSRDVTDLDIFSGDTDTDDPDEID